jgi:DNA-binding XRE family transcriptional regulator
MIAPPKLDPTTTDPLLLEIFAEADRSELLTSQLAKIAGVNYRTLQRIRRPHVSSQVTANLTTAHKLAKALGKRIVLG